MLDTASLHVAAESDSPIRPPAGEEDAEPGRHEAYEDRAEPPIAQLDHDSLLNKIIDDEVDRLNRLKQ